MVEPFFYLRNFYLSILPKHYQLRGQVLLRSKGLAKKPSAPACSASNLDIAIGRKINYRYIVLRRYPLFLMSA